MIEEETLDLIIAIYSIIAAITFTYSGSKNEILKAWIPAVIVFGIGAILAYLNFLHALLQIIGNSLYVVALVWIISIVFHEYLQFNRDNMANPSTRGYKMQAVTMAGLALMLLTPIETTLLLIRIALLILELLACLMLLRIYQIKRTPTRGFMLLTLLAAFLALFTTLLSSLAIPGAWELSYVTNFIFLSFIVATAFVARLEVRLVESEQNQREAFNRADFYKDLFVHDINNILQNIQSSHDLITMYHAKPEADNIERILGIINDQVARGARLVSSIRKLSKIEDMGTSIRHFEASAALQQAIDLTKKSFPQKKIQIELESPNNEISVKANELLSDIFENLLLNAVKHNRNIPIEIRIEISSEFEDGEPWIKFQFKDNGIGIKDTRKEIIFQRRYDDHYKTEGMGLGLTLVKKIVDSYSGKIWVEDRVSGDYTKGSNFILLIPEG